MAAPATAAAAREVPLGVALARMLGTVACARITGTAGADGTVALGGFAPSAEVVDQVVAAAATLPGAGPVIRADVDVVPAPCAAYALVQHAMARQDGAAAEASAASTASPEPVAARPGPPTPEPPATPLGTVPAGTLAARRASAADAQATGAPLPVDPAAGAPGGRGAATAVPKLTFADGEPIRFALRTPAFASHVTVDAFMTTGEVVHLDAQNWPGRFGPDAKLGYGKDEAGVPLAASEPHGINLFVIVATARPLFDGPRPLVEPAERYAFELAAAIDRAERQGVPLEPTFLLIETVARDPLGADTAAAR